jgi:hypothetical protein
MSSVKATIPLLLMVALAAGCKNALDLYESKAPAPVVVSAKANGMPSLALRDFSSVGVLITGVVQQVKLPSLNSPSVAGDNATCTLLVPARSIPAHPDVRKVALHYDNHGWLQGLKAGAQLVLRFRKNGEFDGLQLSASFIQPNGAGNRSQR